MSAMTESNIDATTTPPAPDCLTLTFQYEGSEIDRGLRAYYLRGLWKFLFVMLLLAAVTLAAHFLDIPIPARFMEGIIIVALVMSLLYMIPPDLFLKSIPPCFRRGTQRWTLSARGILIEAENSMYSVEWRDVWKYRETRHFHLIVLTPTNVAVLPKRVLAQARAEADFARLAFGGFAASRAA